MNDITVLVEDGGTKEKKQEWRFGGWHRLK